MCGRFSITGDLDFYAEYFGVDEVRTERLEPNWNVAPTDPVYVIAERDGVRVLETMRWGLVPHWVKDARSIQINARSETAATSAMFRESLARRRCLIPADGFYEWEPKESGRTAHWVYRADGHPMVFAGIWATRRDQGSDAWQRTCSIITAPAEGVIAPIHDRMPVSLMPGTWDVWLDRDQRDTDEVVGLLRAIEAEEVMEHTVSSRVNSVRNNGPELQKRADPETLF